MRTSVCYNHYVGSTLHNGYLPDAQWLLQYTRWLSRVVGAIQLTYDSPAT
jgi:hypothetical protein